MNHPLPVLPPRFRDVAYVAEGAFGQVYRALTEGDRPVAIKVLAAEWLGNADAVWRFSAEYRRLAALHHPAFPQAVEDGLTEDGHPYYAMTFLPGTPLGAEGSLAPARARAVLGRVAEALRHLHGVGLVHGDLKADNILLAEEDAVYVLDVGTAGPIGQRSEDVAGTLEYMAPEVLRQADMAPEADWYALGALGYLLLSGRTPFVAGEAGPAALVRAQLFEAPPALPKAVLGEAPDLAAAVMSLLVKEPEQRSAALAEVFATLGLVVATDAVAGGLRSGGWVPRSAIHEAWTRLSAPDGAGAPEATGASTLVVEGPAGSGKSRALDALRLEARMAGRPWLAASCGGAGDAPGAVARVVLRQALAAAGTTPAPAVSVWLAGRIPTEWLDLEPRARKLALQRALGDAWVEATGALGSLIVGLDDWHLADAGSQELLEHLRRHPKARRARWVLTSEPEASAPEGAARLGLDAWSPSEVAALADTRLGEPAPTTLLDVLSAVGADWPGLIIGLIDHWHATGALARGATGWHFSPERTQSAGADPWLRLWREKIDRLPEDALALARLAAVVRVAGPVPPADLGAVAGLSGPRTQAALDVLLAQSVLVPSSDGVRLAQMPAPEQLSDALGGAARADMATRLARRLIAVSDVPEVAELEALPLATLMAAAHLASLGHDDELAVALTGVAARRALEHTAIDAARRLVEAARPRLAQASPARRLTILLVGAEAGKLLDQTDAAAADFEAALAAAEEVQDAAAAAQALLGLAKGRQLKGRYDEAFGYAERSEAAAAQAGDKAMGARAAVALARIALFMGAGHAAVIAACTRAAVLATEAGSPTWRSAALNLHGVLLSQEDPTQREAALAMIRQAIGLAEDAGDVVATAAAMENLGNAYLSLGDLREAESAFAQGASICRTNGIGTEGLSADMNHALVLAELGETSRAHAIADDVAGRAEKLGRTFIRAIALAARGQAAWRAADVTASAATLDEALALAQGIKNRLAEEYIRLYRLEAFLGTGDPVAAAAEAEAVGVLLDQTDHAEGRERLASLKVELLRQTGREAEAQLEAGRFLAGENQVFALAACQVSARILQQSGQSVEAAGRYAQAAAIARDWNSGWHLAAALAGLAKCQHSREAAISLAHETLLEPSNPYAAAGAAWVLAAHGALDASAYDALEGLSGALADLTPERRDAVLTAQGLPDGRALEELRQRASASGGRSFAGIDTLAAWVDALLHAENEHAVHETLVSGLMGLTAAERGYMLGYERGRLIEVVTRGVDYAEEVEQGFSSSIAEEALFTGEPIYLVDASAEERWRAAASVQSLGLRTVIAVPYGTLRQILGVVYMDRAAIEPLLGDTDMRALTLLAGTAASRIAALRREHELASELAFERTVADAAVALACARTPQARQNALLDAALTLTGAERALWLSRGEGDAGWAAIATRDRSGGSPSFRPDVISRSVLARAVEEDEPMCLVETDKPEGWNPGQSLLALGIRMVWCLPARPELGEWIYLDTPRLDADDPHLALKRLAALVARLAGAV